MPIYEFVCAQCSHGFEELVLRRDEKVSCPECGSDRLDKAMSTFSFSSGGTYHSSAGSECTGCAKTSCGGCGHSH